MLIKLFLAAILSLPLSAANYYVRSAAAGTGDGSTWANAYTTLAAALTARAAGDVFWVADDHAETQSATMTLTAPGTAASRNRILCVNTHVTEPPTALATSCTVSTSSTGIMNFAGFAYSYGIAYAVGNTASTASMSFLSASSWGWSFDSGALRITSTSSASKINFGLVTSSAADDQYLELVNTPLQFGNAGQSVQIGKIRLIWRNTASAIAGTAPTTLFVLAADTAGRVEVSGVDLSALGSGKNLVAVGTASVGPTDLYFRNCQLGSSVSVITGAITGQGAIRVYLDNSDSGNVNYRMEHYSYQGSVKTETVDVRTSGASDGTTPISWKMTSLSTGPALFSPLESAPIVIWNETTGSSMTATIEILHDSTTALKNDEVWTRCEYLGTSGVPLSTYVSNRVADAMTTAANQTTSSATWTTTGLTNPNTQKLVTTFTPQVKGLVACRVMLAKANYSVFVDPVITLQ